MHLVMSMHTKLELDMTTHYYEDVRGDKSTNILSTINYVIHRHAHTRTKNDYNLSIATVMNSTEYKLKYWI